MTKKALLTSVTSQDSIYLIDLLINKGYQIHGIVRRGIDLKNLLIDSSNLKKDKITLHYGDLTDGLSLIQIIKQVQPDEIYNLGAQTHVAISFKNPEYTANVNSLGTLRILEAIRTLGLIRKTKIFQASTAEIFAPSVTHQDETSPFHPKSPYAVSKLFSYWSIINYRESYDMFACNGILYNHESPLRGENFVTRKITRTLTQIKLGLKDCLFIGNVDAARDWGHAKDFVEAEWMMLQQEHPSDYVIATGEKHSVEDFILLTATLLDLKLSWEGSGITTKAIDQEGICRIAVDPNFYRPLEHEISFGNPAKAKQKVGWQPKTKFEDLVKEMTLADLKLAEKELDSNVKRKIFC